MTDAKIILVTAPDVETAGRLVRTLVEERLAACGNIVPGLRSIYRWQDEVHDEAEVLIVLKTVEARVAAVIERVPQLHPYDVPEVLVLPVEAGSGAYLEWVRQESSGERS